MLILGGISEAIAGMGVWITVGVYKVAGLVFELFLILASGQLLKQEQYELLITNFYLVLGIIMLFVLAFSLLKGMVNPDDQKQGASTIKKVIINIITSAIIMAVLPTIFSFLYDFQNSFILNQNTIGKFFGYGSADTIDNPSSQSNLEKVRQGSYQIVNGVYTAFFNVNLDECTIEKDTNLERMVECQKTVDAEKKKTVYDKYDKKNIKLDNLKETIKYVDGHGKFGLYSQYAQAIDKDQVDFNFLLCLVGGFLLIYVGVSYCFDMALRLVKLVFYQLIAPIPIFFRIVPEGKLSGTFNQWTKITLTCYLEVYVRIFIFYFCVFLCAKMIEPGTFLGTNVYEQYGIFLGLLAKAFVLMGVITFMRQAPKLISEITGLDSGNMKLGIRDKLAAGGAFAAGAIVGGGATALTRNAVNGIGNVKNKWGEAKGIKGKAGLIAGAFGSTIAGGVSGAVRSGKAGMGAKSWGDMTKSAGSGAKGAVDARDSRAAYKASHGGTVRGAMLGHLKDTGRNIGEWAGVGVGDANLGYYTTAAQSTNSFNDLSESTYKKKQEYMDQNSVVKALQSRVAAAKAAGKNTEAKKLEKELAIEEAALIDMQRRMATKKKDVISIAATRLSVDQHSKYSHDQQFIEAYENAIYEGFKVSAEDFKRSRIEERVEIINGNEVTTKQRIFFDADGNEKKAFNSSTTQMFDAMLAGGEIKDEWINQDNVILIQDAIDKANIGRQHIKTQKEREHIVNTGNRSTEKKDN